MRERIPNGLVCDSQRFWLAFENNIYLRCQVIGLLFNLRDGICEPCEGHHNGSLGLVVNVKHSVDSFSYSVVKASSLKDAKTYLV